MSEYKIAKVFEKDEKHPNIYDIISLGEGKMVYGDCDGFMHIGSFDTFFDVIHAHGDLIKEIHRLADNRIATGSFDGKIKFWKKTRLGYVCDEVIDTGDCADTFIELKDGRIASGCDDRIIKIWEKVKSGWKCVTTLKKNVHKVSKIIQLDDGRLLSGGCSHASFPRKGGMIMDKTLQIWKETAKNKWVLDEDNWKDKFFNFHKELRNYDDKIWDIMQLKDGRIVAAGNDTLDIFAKDEKGVFMRQQKIKGHDGYWGRAYTDKGPRDYPYFGSIVKMVELKDGRIATGSSVPLEDDSICIWEDRAGFFECTQQITEKGGRMRKIIELNNGNLVISRCDKTTVLRKVTD